MCNIWKRKKEFEISPEQLHKILMDPLYSKVTHIGITGGEPTLRNDLDKLYLVCIRALPRLRGLSIITNAIQTSQVISRIEKVIKICQENKVPFSIMVSLDGVGVKHDNIRGRKGNFESVMEVINYFKNNHPKVPISIGCTITKDNAWDADGLLYFLKKEGIYGRFRIAESINKLYNNELTDKIRNFNNDEIYNLSLFFKKLELSYESDETIKRTYGSIFSLLNGNKRAIGCPYQKNGIVLNSKSELSYCAPKSKIIGSALEKSSLSIYRNNLSERRRIINEECSTCIHDYHAGLTFREYKSMMRNALKYYIFTITGVSWVIILARFLKLFSKRVRRSKKTILIIGWYGTETVGDKAILGGIVDSYIKKYGPDTQFVISSLYPFVTRKTLMELNIQNKAIVIPCESIEFIKTCISANEIVMGGGPLMDLEQLWVPLLAFSIGNLSGNRNVVLGCGIGPLNEQKYRLVVQKILHKADYVYLRDQDSVNWAKSNAGVETELVDDPASWYIKDKERHIMTKEDGYLACFLRELPPEYFNCKNQMDFQSIKEKFEFGLSRYLKSVAEKFGAPIRLFHMHNFTVGNDDRDFSRYFIDKYFDKKDRISLDEGLSTVDSIITAMKSSKYNICMRYHSVLFAQTLGLDFSAIDYTRGGKIYSFLKQHNMLDKLVQIDELITTHSTIKDFEGTAY